MLGSFKGHSRSCKVITGYRIHKPCSDNLSRVFKNGFTAVIHRGHLKVSEGHLRVIIFYMTHEPGSDALSLKGLKGIHSCDPGRLFKGH